MRALWLEPDENYLDQRRRWGADRGDEVWDGVLHMVPPPAEVHERVVAKLIGALLPICSELRQIVHSGGLFDHDQNYRVPDITIAREDQISDRGFEGAELVIEVLSPNDESREKFPFFAKKGVREVWLIEPVTRAIELYELRNGSYVRQLPVTLSPVLGITIEQRDGQLQLGDAII